LKLCATSMTRAGICPGWTTRAWRRPGSGGADCETPAPALSSSARNNAQAPRQNRTTLLGRASDPNCRSPAPTPTRPFPRHMLEDICTPFGRRDRHAPRFWTSILKIVNPPRIIAETARTICVYAIAYSTASQNTVASRGPDFGSCTRRPHKWRGWCTQCHRTPRLCVLTPHTMRRVWQQSPPMRWQLL